MHAEVQAHTHVGFMIIYSICVSPCESYLVDYVCPILMVSSFALAPLILPP